MTVKRIKFKFIQIKARTSGSCLIERKMNSLKRGKVVNEEQAESPKKALHLECIMNVLIARTFWLCLKARTFWPRLIERKLNSLKRGEAVHVVVAEGVVGLVGVDNEGSGSPERALLLK